MITILDGGMGQELVTRSRVAPTPLWSTRALLDEPELVRAVHDDFFEAGAMVATTNSYAIQRERLRPAGLDDRFEALHHAACEIACRARDAAGSGRVAGAIGPLTGSYRTGPLPEDATDRFAEICRIQAAYVDLFLIETVCSISHVRSALEGADALGKPIWLALSVDDNDGRFLRSGEPLETAINAAGAADAVLINCATPEAVSQALDVIKGIDKPFGAYANGFTHIASSFVQVGATVKELTKRTDFTPKVYADFAESWRDLGTTIIGGCCEVGPAHICELARRLT